MPNYIGSRTIALTLAAGDTFGWYVQSIDSRDGAGSLAIAAADVTLTPSSAVPEPETTAMLLTGMGLMALARRRKES